MFHPLMNRKEGEEKNIITVDYRLYPNSMDEKKMDLIRSYCGYLYNLLLEDEIRYFTETGKKRSVFDLKKRITRFCNDSPEMKRKVYSTCRRNVVTRLTTSGDGVGSQGHQHAGHLALKTWHISGPSDYRHRMGTGSWET